MEETPLVSVWMITYNHEKYIAQALESVVSQKTTFPFEVVIGEDCSTDGTRAIIQQYEKQYPHLIKPVYHEKNVGAFSNAYEYCYPKLKGKYIAGLEGDDYWIDPLKLQKQVDLLEKDPSIVWCASNVDIVDSQGAILSSGEENSGFKTGYINFLEVLNLYRFYTGTILFRNFFKPYGKLTQFPEEMKSVSTMDWFLALMCGYYWGTDKNYYNFPEKFGCYRKHDTGVWTPVAIWKKHFMFIELYKQFNKLSKNEFQSIIKSRLSDVYFQAFKSLMIDKKYLASIKALRNSISLNPLGFFAALQETFKSKLISK